MTGLSRLAAPLADCARREADNPLAFLFITAAVVLMPAERPGCTEGTSA
jgi:hypothetical protein